MHHLYLAFIPRAVSWRWQGLQHGLRDSNKMIREEMERGVFDIEAVKQANADLIGTINESLQIADEGKARRAAAEVELKKMETELRDTLASAKARRDGVGDTAATSVPAS